jgi:hypothetical protein
MVGGLSFALTARSLHLILPDVIARYALLVSGSVLLAAVIHFVHHYVLLIDAYTQAVLAGR